MPGEPPPRARLCLKCGRQYDGTESVCLDDGERLVVTGQGNPGPRVGDQLGNYLLSEVLGEGGMGRVFMAKHTRLDRKVALKVLNPDLAGNPTAARRFFSEARAVNQINHENIIEINDFCDDGPDKYYIMELLDGESLLSVMRRDGFVPLRRILSIAIQACDALAAVHGAGMVHRDFKPENVYLIERAGKKDFVKLLDFGVVKLGSLEIVSTDQTAAGALLGTPEYMSPEQVSSSPVDFRTDIYALGVVLFEAVTGRKPFTAKSFGEMVVQHLTVKPLKPSALKDVPQAIPPKLEALILHCLAKDRENRPGSMQEVSSRLRAILDELPAEEITMPRRSRRGLWIAAAVLVAAGGAGLAARQALLVDGASPAPGTVPARVEMTFESSPAGAEVFEGSADNPLGVTPLTVSLGRSEKPREFRFRLAGYEPATKQVSLRANGRILARLAAIEKVEPRKSSAVHKKGKGRQKEKSAGKRGTLDPFAD